MTAAIDGTAEKTLMSKKKLRKESAAENLVPVFIPPLASFLARAEELKGSRLTETDVLRIRDQAACIMMAAEDAEKMVESRGFRDIEPENCWSDWHRLRVQLTGNGYLPKIVLCILGGKDLKSRCGDLLEKEGVEHEWRKHDERMLSAFKASTNRSDPSLSKADLANIDGHARVLYVVSSNFTASDAPGECRKFLSLGHRLLEAGALAMKCESSGIAHGRARWIELAQEAEGADPWPALFRAYVQSPIQDGDDYHSCGLHLLGQPDLIVSGTLLRDTYNSTKDHGWAAVNLFGAFGCYLLAECAPGQFGSGHTFSQDAESPRFRVRWEECTGYEEDDFFFNPFGRWRFAELAD
jgi:hypothetical protein